METSFFRTVTAQRNYLRKALARLGGMMLFRAPRRVRRGQGFLPILYIRGKSVRPARMWLAKIRLSKFFRREKAKIHMMWSFIELKRADLFFHRGVKLQLSVISGGKMSLLELFWIKGRWRFSAGWKNSLRLNFEKRAEIGSKNFFSKEKIGGNFWQKQEQIFGAKWKINVKVFFGNRERGVKNFKWARGKIFWFGSKIFAVWEKILEEKGEKFWRAGENFGVHRSEKQKNSLMLFFGNQVIGRWVLKKFGESRG